MELTPEQIEKAKKVVGLKDSGQLILLKEIETIGEKVSDVESNVAARLDSIEESVSRVSEELKKKLESELVLEIDREELRGKDGEDYVLKETDLEEIAAMAMMDIEVPVVEKVIERTEVIRETPIVTENVVEKAITDKAEVIRDKLETLEKDERLDKSAIKGLEEYVDNKTLDRAVSILDSRTSFLLNKINNLPTATTTTVTPEEDIPDFVSETNTLAAHLGATAYTANIVSLYGAGNWRMVAHGYDKDGVTPLAVFFNTDNKEFLSATWTVAGGIVTKNNHSMLKGVSDDIMFGTAGEVTSMRHSAAAWRVHLGMIFVTCNVFENISGTYQPSYIALAYSSDYGATFSLCNLHETGTFASRSGNAITVTGMTTGFVTGQPVKYTSTGTNITGLTSGTLYYAIVTSPTTFSLATSQTNALAGTEISLSGDGSGTQTFTTAYDVTPGSYVNLAPSSGLSIGQHWCMTIQPVSDTRIDVGVADYHANPNSPGGTFYYAQFTGGAGAWTAKKLRRVQRLLGTGLHCHMGYDHKIFYGDTSMNQSYRFVFDAGDDYYETSGITITQIEATGYACQTVNATSDINGRTIMSPDNTAGIVVAWDDDRDIPTPIFTQDVGVGSGGNESFMIHRAYGLGVPALFYQPFRHTASLGVTDNGRRYAVSKDGIAWAIAGYDTDYNDSSAIMAAVAYEDGTPYLIDLTSGTFNVKELKLVDCTPTPSAKGGTNVLTSALTPTALTDAVVTECPLIDGEYVWPTGTTLAGERISPQPANKTAKVYYVEAATGSGDELNLDMGSTVGAGNYIAKAYVMSASGGRNGMTVKLTNTSDASVTTWNASNTLPGYWREVNPFYSPSGTVTLRVKFGLPAGYKGFIQTVGIHSGRLPLDDHNFGLATIPDNTYETDIPTTNPTGGGTVISRFRLSGKFDSYAANQNSTSAIVLAEYYQDANNHIQLRVTPNATVTSVSTFTVVQTIAGIETTLATETGWLNNRDEIVFGISRDGTNGGVFANVGESNLTGDFSSASIYASTVRAGHLPCDHLFSIVNGDIATRTGAELAAIYPYMIDTYLATITGYRVPVGTVDSSNQVFDVKYIPSRVESDGVGLVEGFGYTYASGQITLDIAPKYFIRYI